MSGIKVIALSVCLTVASLSALAAPHGHSDDMDEQQKRHKRPQFSELDLNGDAYITLQEFQQHEIPHGDHETVFGHIDADGNGEITQEEFESHRPPKRKGRETDKQRN